MDRINITQWDDEAERTVLVGWFDRDRAQVFPEAKRWDGANNISVITGQQWEGEALYKTAQGKWVLNRYSRARGSSDRYRYVTEDEARTWLVRCEYTAEAIAEAGLGEVPEEVGPSVGRPAIGGTISVALGDERLRRVDDEAARRGVRRAELIRDLVDAGLSR